MSIFLNKRKDGSVALFIDGDLQFDETDEGIYHRGLTGPAMELLAARRISHPLRALIIGGGDGLSARDLLQSSAISHIDLVDYSAEMIGLAKNQLAALNCGSLNDARVTVHIEDAWKFVAGAIEKSIRYDLIVVDLTVAKDATGAKFHGVEWYSSLAALLSPEGIVAANCVSPTSTPRAYWSIFNSMLTAELCALPYRVHLPSFTSLGYGTDWGFILAAKTLRPSEAEHISNQDQFVFPAGFEAIQKQAQPAANGSGIFLHYLLNDEAFVPSRRGRWDALKAMATLDYVAPDADCGSAILPLEIRQRLAAQTASIFPDGDSGLLSDVLQLMPALQPTHTRKMIADFIADPAIFLEALDIRALVGRLVRRASELPARVAAELRLLQEKLIDWGGDLEALLSLGRRVVTTLAVVVILANFIAPDAAYGKGEHGGGGGRAEAGRGDRGDRGDHGDRGNWNRGWGRDYGRYGGWGRPGHWGRWGYGGYGWGGWGGYYGSGPGYQVNNYNTNNQSTDSGGNQYPSRAYNVVQTYGTVPDQPWIPPAGSTSNTDNSTAKTSVSANLLNTAYRLGPDVDILPTGTTVLPLSDNAYLKVGPQASDIIDQASGKTLISLLTDPALTWHISSELKQQASGLQKAAQPGTADGGSNNADDDDSLPSEVAPSSASPATALKDAAEAKNMMTTVDLLARAEKSLGSAPDSAPPPANPPVSGAFELFNSTWADPSGRFVIMKRADGSLVYLDGRSWYSDEGKTKLADPYPAAIKPVIVSYLSDLARDSASTKDSLAQEQSEITMHLTKMKDHLSGLQSGGTGVIGPNGDLTSGGGGTDLVPFGTKKIPRNEAIKRLQSLITRAQKRLDAAQNEANNLPQETEAVNKLLSAFQN